MHNSPRYVLCYIHSCFLPLIHNVFEPNFNWNLIYALAQSNVLSITISVQLNFSTRGGRKFARVQRHANIYEFAGDTDLGHRDI